MSVGRIRRSTSARRRGRRLRSGRPHIVTAVMVAVVGAAQLLAAPIAAASAPQTITFNLPAAGVVGTSIPLAATATSGLPVSFATDSPVTCSVAGQELTLLAEGICGVTASQPGDATWAAAPDAPAAMTVDPSPFPRQPQTITFALPPSGYVGSTMSLTGTASSGLNVSYTVQTPSVCATDGTTLALDAAGTCTVTASQPGNQDEWLAAPDVAASTTVKLPPFVTSDGANLGRYALNGPIQSMVIDPATGITYVGGGFTEIGVRTGSVALVNPPDSGSDALKASSPDVIGSQLKTFPDDATGYFVTGFIASVNGDGIRRDVPASRMTTDGKIDGSWKVGSTCGTTQLPNWANVSVQWDLGDKLVAYTSMAPTTSEDSTIGLVFIDKATGIARRTGAGNETCGADSRIWPNTPAFAPLASCAGWAVCNGYVIDVVEDPGSNSLVVAAGIYRGQTVGTQERRQTWLMAYDLTTGARRWATRLEASSAPVGTLPNTDWGGYVRRLSGLGGSIVVSGFFPLEPVGRPIAQLTNTLLVDSATGTILQRWNQLGEQDLADPLGPEVVPATACTPVDDSLAYEVWRFVARSATHAVGYGLPTVAGDGTRTYPVCDYSVSGSGLTARLSATSVGMLAATRSLDVLQPMPSALYGGHILVGPFDAFDLNTGSQIGGWHPSPSSGMVTLAVAGSTIAIVGESTFLHGARAFHVAALDRDLAPVAGFHSGLLTLGPSAQDFFRALALDGNRIVVIGRLLGSGGASHMIALDKSTGDVAWTAPSTATTLPYSLAVDPATGAAYVGLGGNAGTFLRRYLPDGAGFQQDPAFNPTFIDLDGGYPLVSALSWIGGRLYVGGEFKSIDGQARQSLARFGVDRSLDGWAPNLVDEMRVPAGATIELAPYSFLEVGGNVVATGRFLYKGSGGYLYGPPGVRVYSATTGALVRPLDSASWYGYTTYEGGYGIATIDGIVYVALGATGIAAFDATTFDYLPYLSVRTFNGWGNNSIYAIAARTTNASSTTAGLQSASTPTSSLVFGGVVPSWHNHTASNVLELGTGALNGDHAAPTTSAVSSRPRTGGAFAGSAAPWYVAWTGSDTGGSGVARYELSQSRNGGAWSVVSVNLLGPSAALAVIPGSLYQFRVRAVDRAGNVGAWAVGSIFKVTAIQQSSRLVRYRGTWSPVTSTTLWWGGSAKRSSTRGSTATLTFTGRSIAWVGLKGANRGKANVYINGTLKGTVNLYSATTQKKRVVWSWNFATAATRTITIKILGTSGRPRVDIDGFIVGR